MREVVSDASGEMTSIEKLSGIFSRYSRLNG